MDACWGGVEAGGTTWVVVTGDASGTIRERCELPTTTPQETLARVVDWLRPRRVGRVGVACFGPLSADLASIARTPKPLWSHTPVRELLARALGVPVHMDTDVNGAVLAEAALGAGQGCDPLVYVTVGTGIGGGALVGGRLLRGRPHPEMGHVPVPRQPGDLFAGSCPFHGGCLEGMAAAPAIRARWGREPPELGPGHPAWDLEARYLASGLAAMTCVLAPARVVLGGGVGRRPGLAPLVEAALWELLAGYFEHPPAVVAAGLGADAGPVGALLLARDL